MAVVGYNYYLNGVKLNDTPTLQPFTFSGLVSNNDYAVTATAVDAAGNESAASTVLAASTSQVVQTDGPMSDADKAGIDAIVAASKAANGQPGIMVAITGPKGFYSKAYGTSDTTTNLPLSLDDHFRIGSVTKTFTSHAVMMNIDAGNLALTDTLDQYVAGVPSGDLITIEMLLSHRSGVAEYLSNTSVQMQMLLNPTGAFSETSAMDIIKAGASQFVPGSQWQYTNSNYVVLGAVLGAITGRTIKQIITEDIIVPQGLTETSWPNDSELPEPYTKGAGPSGLLGLFGLFGDVHRFNPEIAGAAGAIVSTMADLVKWTKIIRDGTLISAELHQLWLNTWYTFPNTLTGPATLAYSYGLTSFGSWYGHNGAFPGYEDVLFFERDTGAVIVVMENISNNALPMQDIFVKAADYLYPGSMAQRDYTGTRVAPSGASLAVSGGVPSVRIDTPNKVVTPAAASLTLAGGTPTVEVANPNKVVTPAGAVLTIIGGTPGANPVEPAGASLAITGGTPTVTVAEVTFSPIFEENVNRIDRPIPAGSTGCWVTLIGGGGGGGAGSKSTSGFAHGGAGGGGGGKVERVFIPVASLDTAYSVTRGAGGTGGVPITGSGRDGTAGGASTFASGGVSLSAGGGGFAPGGAGPVTGGAGGTCSVSGVSAATQNGTPGADNGPTGSDAVDAPDNTTGGAPGGGGGGSMSTSTVHNGSNGGDSATAAGGEGGNTGGAGVGFDSTAGGDGSAGNAGGGGGGGRSYTSASGNGTTRGQPGGVYGAGGGGGGGKRSSTGTTAAPGGDGAVGYTMIEWV